MLVHLQSRDGPHVVDRALYSSLQGAALSVTINQNHHFLCSHHGTYTYGECGLRHLVDVVVKETAVGNDRVSGQGLLTCATAQA